MDDKKQSLGSKVKEFLLLKKADVAIIFVFFLLSLFFFKNTLGVGMLMNNGHYLHEQAFFSYNFKAAAESGALPLWTPYWYGGQPFFGDSQVFFFNLTYLLVFLIGDISLSIMVSSMLYFFIGLVGMYALCRHFEISRGGSVIASLVFMLNGLIRQFIVAGNPSILEPYSLIPWLFLFTLLGRKAQDSKIASFWAIGAGITVAFQIFSGGVLVVLYTAVLLGAYFGFDLVMDLSFSRVKRVFLVGSLVLVVFLGVSAIKLLPNYGFIGETNRAQGVSYQEYIGEDHFVLKDTISILAFPAHHSSHTVHIGFAGLVLLFFSLAFLKKRIVLFFWLLSVFLLVLASGGFLAELFYNYVPGFAQTRHIVRVLFVFTFAVSILVGFGWQKVHYLIISKVNESKRKYAECAMAVLICVIILSELLLFKGIPSGFSMQEQLNQNHLAKKLERTYANEGPFRITTFDVKDVISFFGSSYYAQYGLETLSGGGGLWINDYVEYLSVAKSYNSAKMLGILNLRYVTSTKQVNVSGFREVEVVEKCFSCEKVDWTYWIGGPYLYENEEFVPRYYTVPHAILVVGSLQDTKQVVYSLLLNEKFSPRSVVVVTGQYPSVGRYDLNFLQKFDTIILLSGSVDQNAFPLLGEYKGKGGAILPDVTKKETSIDMERINELLERFDGKGKNVSGNRISPNELKIGGERGEFIVLSEKFSLFEEWEAVQGTGRVPILRANNVISAVYSEGSEDISFRYSSQEFERGVLIFAFTLFIIFIYVGMALFSRWKKQRAPKKEV